MFYYDLDDDDIAKILIKNNIGSMSWGKLTKRGHPRHPRSTTNNDKLYNLSLSTLNDK